MPACEINYKKL